ncbi:chromosome segregation protein SMC [Vagococcus intermedius]|uniref:Chromosome partition protein Smc n=1 Tax=Vagococcus intermedius TaxID=2991418 RepID=A0AAF0CUK5_9ENTE|nr:chromosome segregation protein SMC [Vagococcus intermedius]WEG73152.1 chromosome segregation protein SMC [Vagococcus intermedius]WEG75236.1 chromosome segregation protein SMC [Vagococcus intermedius]
MYLKRLEIAGFKSFAERTVIEFDRGLTAVVGPNGSGKSNITEAIRWVLGEQSAKSLRGGKMPDVIFAGTTKRKQLNVAEVTVVLDNEERFLPLDFSEVSVTRRLKRNGDSDFYINKQSCRLKDIIELFMDSGLGKESFSIISQGKVEAIFNSKPEDRRGIFEEAAGVLKYKQRKRQAEQKLFETEDNLNRVQDIVYELEVQLEPLRDQSQRATKYLSYQEELTKLDVGVAVADILTHQELYATKESSLTELDTTLLSLSKQIDTFDRQLINLNDKRASLDQQLDEGQQELLVLTEAYEQTEGQKNVLAERSQNVEKTTSEYANTLENLEVKLEAFEEEREALLDDLKTKEVKQKELRKAVKELETAVQMYSKSAKEQLADLRSEYIEVMQESATVGNELKFLEKQHEQENSKNRSALSQHEMLVEKNQKLVQREEQANIALASYQETVLALSNDLKEVERQLTHRKQEFEVKEKQMYDALKILQQAQARQKSLQELQDNYAGFYQGVREVLKAKTELNGIVGAVAELIQVPKEYALGIETALGGAAQHVVVENEQAGRAGIAYLKKKRIGRATFLPLTTVRPRKLADHILASVRQTEGFIGIASELISYDQKVSPIIANLLGVTLLARDLASANRLATQVNYQYRVVSLEGDVMNPGGSMTGGATRKGGQGNLFAQAGELKVLNEHVAQMESQLSQRETLVTRLKTELAHLNESYESLRQQNETARFKEQELGNTVELLKNERQQLDREQQVFAHETKGLTQFLTDYEAEKVILEQKLAALQAKKDQLDQEMADTDALEVINTKKREEAQESLQKNQGKLAVITEQINHAGRLISDCDRHRQEIKTEMNQLKEQLETLTTHHSTHHLSQEALIEKMSELQTQKSDWQERLKTYKLTRDQVNQEIAESDERLTAANKERQALLSQKSQAEVLKSRSELGMDNTLKHLQEEYSLTFEAAKASYSLELEVEEARQKVKELKKEINGLGAINVSAIEQFEEVNERYTFLTTQRSDLLEAKDSLYDTMNEMDEVVKVKFEEIFTAIREKFQETFPSMFGGGYADLRLTDPSDLLNTGIEIVAQPPGKKLQSLSLLSGGERALTAIALLFSIIQVRPVPFCILDEVEAALDEANVARFGHYLSHFEDDTQFIVITHRKGTMEAADVLYGVTMQESGVSKIVSVRVEEISANGDIDQAPK